MKKIFYYLMILVLGLSMVSCEKSDDGDSGYASKIIGTWQLEKMWESESGWESVGNDGYDRVIFNNGGTGKRVEYYHGETYEDAFSWEISENSLMVKSDGESEESTIISLTNENLILEYQLEEYGEHWKEQYVKIK